MNPDREKNLNTSRSRFEILDTGERETYVNARARSRSKLEFSIISSEKVRKMILEEMTAQRENSFTVRGERKREITRKFVGFLSRARGNIALNLW